MGYEIDCLAVGDESKSGDAITFRYGNLNGSREEQTVIVIDAGYAGDGTKVVEHVKKYYGTNWVDVVVSTHPDNDHAGGLRTVLEELGALEFWMHKPGDHAVAELAAAGRHALNPMATQALREALSASSDLQSIAEAKGVPIVEPFTGVATQDGAFRVLGPSRMFYDDLIAQVASHEAGTVEAPSLLKAVKEFGSKILESFDVETLTDDGETSPMNNTSVIGLLDTDGVKLLFTADAGIVALENAIDDFESDGSTCAFKFVQIPHHGSRRNAGPAILDRLLGPKVKDTKRGSAYVSAATKGAPKHPSKKVTNAFQRRGYRVFATQGKGLCKHDPATPVREGWSTATALPFYDEVDEDGDD